MAYSEADIRALIAAAKTVRRFWQATCDAHPHREGSWEDHRSFYALADAVDDLENS